MSRTPFISVCLFLFVCIQKFDFDYIFFLCVKQFFVLTNALLKLLFKIYFELSSIYCGSVTAPSFVSVH